MPKYLKDSLSDVKPVDLGLNEKSQDKEKTKHTGVRDNIEFTQSEVLYQDIKNSDMIFTDPEDKILASKNDLIYYSKLEPWEILPFPEKLADNFHDSQEIIEKWSMFRIFPVFSLWMNSINKFMHDLNNDAIPCTPVRLPSLYTYYNLLPKFAREHPIIRNIVRGLEWSKHDVSMKEKEIMLNYACLFTLPMDPGIHISIFNKG